MSEKRYFICVREERFDATGKVENWYNTTINVHPMTWKEEMDKQQQPPTYSNLQYGPKRYTIINWEDISDLD
jgi:hypothetical protein